MAGFPPSLLEMEGHFQAESLKYATKVPPLMTPSEIGLSPKLLLLSIHWGIRGRFSIWVGDQQHQCHLGIIRGAGPQPHRRPTESESDLTQPRDSFQYSCLENPHGQRSLAGYSLCGHKELDVTEWLSTAQHRESLHLTSFRLANLGQPKCRLSYEWV